MYTNLLFHAVEPKQTDWIKRKLEAGNESSFEELNLLE